MADYIHLLYVPTMACNMRCTYCYLDEKKDGADPHGPLETLRFAVEKCLEEDVVPFNISLHGGEVTTLAPEDFRELAAWIDEYGRGRREELTGAGFRVGPPHIKTNLLALDRHLDAIREYQVSVSGSLDLPLSMHEKHRLGADGKGTLDRILKNISLLAELPNHKKVSATIFREHYEHTEEIIRDIWRLHENTCLDMQDFNFMIGFDNGGPLHGLTGEEQADFMQKITDAFLGTELEPGLRGPWFAEFGPGYCTNCDNCGSKFYLLERNGDVYSCVRGQGHGEFYYGNIYRNSMREIMAEGKRKIAEAHARAGFDPACASCRYLYLCKTGCPFVRNLYHSPRSYTCDLQKKLYAFWGLEEDDCPEDTAARYVCSVHPDRAFEFSLPRIPGGVPNLYNILREDPKLQGIYDPEAFILQVDGRDYPLESQILRKTRDYAMITSESRVFLYVREDMTELDAPWPGNNAVFIQLLSGDMIRYGDEGRAKQRHIATEMIYRQVVQEGESDRPGYDRVELSHFFRRFGPHLSRSEANNVFFTTTALREYHYTKQKNNAFYHMQAMDLPFQNLEFYYLDMEGLKNDFTRNL